METVANFILLGSKINPKGNQPWIFIVKTDAEAEAPILWPPGVKSWLTGKDPDAGKDWGQEKKRATDDEMIGWHHQLNGQEFEQTLGSEGRGSLACCSPQGYRVRHDWVTEQQQQMQTHLARDSVPVGLNRQKRDFQGTFSLPSHTPSSKTKRPSLSLNTTLPAQGAWPFPLNFHYSSVAILPRGREIRAINMQ